MSEPHQLSLLEGRLHMTAVYRNHQFVRRAYGNYLGLGSLLGFVAREAACEVGELMCSHRMRTRDRNGAGFGAGALKSLVGYCRAALAESPRVK